MDSGPHYSHIVVYNLGVGEWVSVAPKPENKKIFEHKVHLYTPSNLLIFKKKFHVLHVQNEEIYP